MRTSAVLIALLGLVAKATGARAEPRVAFRFSASSTLFARPGVGRDGSVYVGSGDGYVHALAPDGSFRWSYTLKGRVAAPPVEDPSTGRVFVATSDARLYALESDSHLRWVFPLPVAAKSELGLTPKGTLLFVGQDEHLYGVTTGGALNLRLAAPGARSAPVWTSAGQALLVLGGTLATLKGYGYERAALPAALLDVDKLALGPDRAIFACQDGTARALSGEHEELLVKGECVAAPVRGEGFFAIAEARGVLRLVYAGGQERRIAFEAPLLRPVWDGPRRRLVVASATGAVTVLELDGEGP